MSAATNWEDAYRVQTEAIKELRAENAALRAKLNDPARLHAHCVRHLTDAQVAHLFGERMTAVANDRDRLEAENAALREDKARLDWLEKARPIAWALGSEECGEYWLLTDIGEKHPEEAEEFATLRAAIDDAMGEAQP